MTEQSKSELLADNREQFKIDVVTRQDKGAQFTTVKRRKSQGDNSFSNANVVEDRVNDRKYTISINVSMAGKASKVEGQHNSTELNEDEEQAMADLQKYFTAYLKTIHEHL